MEIRENDLFYTCSLIEYIGRLVKRKRGEVVQCLGRKNVAHIYDHADILHCETIAQTADAFLHFCEIPEGTFDNVAACRYTVSSYWDIGKVYARLIADVCEMDVIETLFAVYQSMFSDAISNYNSDFFYQSREYIRVCYEAGEILE